MLSPEVIGGSKAFVFSPPLVEAEAVLKYIATLSTSVVQLTEDPLISVDVYGDRHTLILLDCPCVQLPVVAAGVNEIVSENSMTTHGYVPSGALPEPNVGFARKSIGRFVVNESLFRIVIRDVHKGLVETATL